MVPNHSPTTLLPKVLDSYRKKDLRLGTASSPSLSGADLGTSCFPVRLLLPFCTARRENSVESQVKLVVPHVTEDVWALPRCTPLSPVTSCPRRGPDLRASFSPRRAHSGTLGRCRLHASRLHALARLPETPRAGVSWSSETSRELQSRVQDESWQNRTVPLEPLMLNRTFVNQRIFVRAMGVYKYGSFSIYDHILHIHSISASDGGEGLMEVFPLVEQSPRQQQPDSSLWRRSA